MQHEEIISKIKKLSYFAPAGLAINLYLNARKNGLSRKKSAYLSIVTEAIRAGSFLPSLLPSEVITIGYFMGTAGFVVMEDVFLDLLKPTLKNDKRPYTICTINKDF